MQASSPNAASPTARSQRGAARRVPRWRKLLYALATTLLFFLAVEAVLAVLGVRPLTATHDPFVGFADNVPLYVEQQDESGRPTMVTAPNKRPLFNLQRFPARKPPGTFRIFCLGGSTTYGRPYDDRASFAAFLREYLARAQPKRTFEVINAGGVSYASYRVAALVEELCSREPDLFLVYSGHNEFLEERTYRDLRERPAALLRIASTLGRTRTYAAVHRLLQPALPEDDGRFILPGEVDARLDHMVGPASYHRDEALRRQVVAHYEWNLHRIAGLAADCGADVLFVTPASNLKDCSPFKSQHRDGLTAEQLRRWNESVRRGAKLRGAGRRAEALAAYDEAAELDDRYAQLHFDRAWLLQELKRYDDARAAFLRARREDVCPLRATVEMPPALARVTADHDAMLVDFRAIVQEACLQRYGHGSPGEEFFLDHVHPNLATTRLLAESIFAALVRRGIVEPVDAWDAEALDRAGSDVAARLGTEDRAHALRNLARVLSWAGKYREAGPLALRALEQLPDDTDLLQLAAEHLKRQGRTEEAMAHYRRAIRLRPLTAEAHLTLGQSCAARGDLHEAEAHFAEAVRLRPDAQTHFLHGRSLAALGRFGDAAECYQASLALEEANADVHAHLAAAEEKRGKTGEALKHYQRALQIDPTHEQARAGRERLRENAAPSSD